jgi:hypothetical protein
MESNEGSCDPEAGHGNGDLVHWRVLYRFSRGGNGENRIRGDSKECGKVVAERGGPVLRVCNYRPVEGEPVVGSKVLHALCECHSRDPSAPREVAGEVGHGDEDGRDSNGEVVSEEVVSEETESSPDERVRE